MSDSAMYGAVGGIAWTPNDDQDLPRVARAFQISEVGDVCLQYTNGDVVVWPACVPGVLHPHYGIRRVLATGTTVSSVVVAY